MAKLITAEYEWFIYQPATGKSHNPNKLSGLADCIAEFNAKTKPAKELDYHKAYRSVRRFGFMVYPFEKLIDIDGPVRVCEVVVVRQVGYQDTTPGLVPMDVLSGGPVEKLQLERLIEQAQAEQQYEELPVWHNTYVVEYNKRNQVTGALFNTRHSITVEAENKIGAEAATHAAVSAGRKDAVYVLAIHLNK